MKSLSRGLIATLSYVATTIGITALSLICSILVAKVLAEKGRGELLALQYYPFLIPNLLNIGLTQGLLFCIKKNPERIRDYFTAALCYSLFLSTLLSSGIFIAMPWLLEKSLKPLLSVAQMLLVFAPLSIGFLLQNSATAQGNVSLVNRMRIFPPLSTSLLTIVLIVLHKVTPLTLAVWTLILSTILNLGFLFFYLRGVPLEFSRLKKTTRELLGVIRLYALNDIALIINSQMISIWMLKNLLSHENGNYIFGTNISMLLGAVQNGIIFTLLPRSMENGANVSIDIAINNVKILILRVLRVIFLLLIIFEVFFWNAIPFGIHLLGKFVVGGQVGQILSLGMICNILFQIMAQIPLSVGQANKMAICQMIGLGVTLLGLYFLVPYFQQREIGVAVAMCFSYVAQMVSMFVILTKNYKIGTEEFIPRRADIVWLFGRFGLKVFPSLT
jgi:O-antigen/teichoic acid export membrane protein